MQSFYHIQVDNFCFSLSVATSLMWRSEYRYFRHTITLSLPHFFNLHHSPSALSFSRDKFFTPISSDSHLLTNYIISALPRPVSYPHPPPPSSPRRTCPLRSENKPAPDSREALSLKMTKGLENNPPPP